MRFVRFEPLPLCFKNRKRCIIISATATLNSHLFPSNFNHSEANMPSIASHSYLLNTRVVSDRDEESGYASGSSTDNSSKAEVSFTNSHLVFLNRQLQFLDPPGKVCLLTLFQLVALTGEVSLDILRWAITTIPNLYQTTAFGLTGLVILDMLSKLRIPRPQVVDLIFLDTLHHFSQTLALVDRVRSQYPLVNIHVYKPAGLATADEFARRHGERLWETNDELYDWHAKVEPAQRAYRELHVNGVLTGRRRSQGGRRGDLSVIEIDEAGLIKINPLANWSFEQVREYIQANNVPYNELLDQGYRSIGDWHSTKPVAEGEDEREGRWKGTQKTECGIHNPRSKFARYLREQELKRQEDARRALEIQIEMTDDSSYEAYEASCD